MTVKKRGIKGSVHSGVLAVVRQDSKNLTLCGNDKRFPHSKESQLK
jgi:hypothetical protein